MPELVAAEPLTPEWHAARRGGVTATDIVTILGLSSWDSAYSLYWRKLGQVPEVEETDRMRLARDLEPIIFLRWLAEHDDASPDERDFWYHESPGLFRSSARAWQMATLDAVVGDHPRHRDVPLTALSEPLELKSWADADRHAWDDGPPPRVRAQVLWQMDVMDVAVGHVGVLFLPSGEFRSYVIEHAPEHSSCAESREGCQVCADQERMLTAGQEFYDRLTYKLPPPDLDASAEVEIVKELTGFTGQACLVRKGEQYFVVSSTVAMFSSPETLVFPATADGDVTDWLEVAGGRGVSRSEAIAELAASCD